MIFLFSLLIAFARADYYNIPLDDEVLSPIAKTSTAPLPNQFSILVWNIYKAKNQFPWAYDMQKLMPGKSLALLQEGVEDTYIPNVLNTFTNFGWWMARSFFQENFKKATGVITGATQEPQSVAFLRSRDLEPVVNTPKMVILTTYTLENGSQLLVANIHAINFAPTNHFQRMIDDLVDGVKTWPGKMIIAGDFNTWNSDRTKYLQEKMSSLGLSEVKFRNETRDLILDRVFVRGCHILQAYIHDDIESSDHSPLTTELKCPQ